MLADIDRTNEWNHTLINCRNRNGDCNTCEVKLMGLDSIHPAMDPSLEGKYCFVWKHVQRLTRTNPLMFDGEELLKRLRGA